MTQRFYTPADDTLLIAGYRAGRSFRQLAADLGRSRASVHSRLSVLADQGRVQRYSPKGAKEASIDDPAISAADRAWMAYWRQPRAVRRAAEARR